MQTPTPQPLLLLLLLLLTLSSAQPPRHPPLDAVPLLAFKSKADLDSKLAYSLDTQSNFCQWQGVKCVKNRVVRFTLQNFGLRGTVPPESLNRLDQLRVLSLRNNSLSGPIPDFSGLINLKTLFLNRNGFSGSFPVSVLSLRTLLYLDLSHNNLTGSIPVEITGLDLLVYLRFDSNRFDGPFPALNQSYIKTFNASSNDFSGAVPVTASLSRFPLSSFSDNPRLCGVIIHVECRSNNSAPPFFFSGPNNASATVTSPPPSPPDSPLSPPFLHNHKRVGVVLGSVLGALVVVTALLCAITMCRSLKSKRETKSVHVETLAETRTKLVPVPQSENKRTEKSGLTFCEEEDESRIYTLEQLMRASAELLGRGTIGTTYKAVMDGGRVTVSVKRLDSGKTSKEVVFEQHMELVGGLRHPNLVPVRAFFKANEERLIVYDYQPNGSLFNLIYGSRSTRAKPLHWTSCLKIADDVAQGLAYIHQASCLVHGNLKSTNVLVGADFEACLTDYCLSTLSDTSSTTLDLDSQRYCAPEIRMSSRICTPKSDVYAFGVLLLEILTGKVPSQHPYLDPTDVIDWVRAMRGDDDDAAEDDRLGMLIQVASVCSLASPGQRPSSRQVLKMIQDIKERVVVEDDTRNR